MVERIVFHVTLFLDNRGIIALMVQVVFSVINYCYLKLQKLGYEIDANGCHEYNYALLVL